MSKSEVSIAIPDELIKGVVMAEMIKALGDREQLVTAVVRAAFEAKDPNSYGRQTLFQASVQKAVLRELDKRKREFADKLANSLLEGRFYVKPSIHVEIGTLTER